MEAIRLLVEKGVADVQERNASTGWVALHESAFRGHVDCVKVCILLCVYVCVRVCMKHRQGMSWTPIYVKKNSSHFQN